MSLTLRSYTVHFTVTGRPDYSGLRIKTTDPIGLYIASTDSEAAQWYFEHMLASLLIDRNILYPEPGEGCAATSLVDWSTALLEGGGKLTLRIFSVEEVLRLCKIGERILSPPVQELRFGRWEYPDGSAFYLIADTGHHIDGWSSEAVTADTMAIQ